MDTDIVQTAKATKAAKKAKAIKVDVRLPKGVQDYAGESYAKLEYLKTVVSKIFAVHNGEYLETPVFELSHILSNKYGEDEKLIYNLDGSATSGFKEDLSLRYDLTIPLVRYCIQNKIDKMRRCTIGKVYRREATSASNQRLREFHQADFDFVGSFGEFIPELSIFCMICQFFAEIGHADYEIVYNYRQILNSCTSLAGIPLDMFSTVCSSIDKLDKYDETYVRAELKTKGLTADQIELLFHFVSDKNCMLPEIREFDFKFGRYLKTMLTESDVSKIRLDRTLARGSDYYTGIIFEVKLTNNKVRSSVAGGGRYDRLIESYGFNPRQMIGFSFGLDRLICLVDPAKIRPKVRPVWVSTIAPVVEVQTIMKSTPTTVSLDHFTANGTSSNILELKLRIVSALQKSGHTVLFSTSDRKFNKEIQEAEKEKCSYIYILGADEFSQNKIKIKDMDLRTESTVELSDLLSIHPLN